MNGRSYVKYSRGFTLIELLVCVAIIGILSSIAVPRFSEYRKRGYDTQAMSDLRNSAIAEEAYFLDHDTYLSCEDAGCLELPGIVGLSAGTRLSIEGTIDQFRGVSSHEKGTGREFVWESENGGLVP